MADDQPADQPPEQASPQPTGEAAPKGNRGSFKKGGDPRQAHLIQEAKKLLQAEKPAAKEVPLPELVPVEGEGMLRAMRHVLMNDDARHDTEPLFKLARESRAQNPQGFGKQFAELEKAERQAVQVVAGEKAAERVPDAGTTKARNLIDRLLSKAAEAAELEVQT